MFFTRNTHFTREIIENKCAKKFQTDAKPIIGYTTNEWPWDRFPIYVIF